MKKKIYYDEELLIEQADKVYKRNLEGTEIYMAPSYSISSVMKLKNENYVVLRNTSGIVAICKIGKGEKLRRISLENFSRQALTYLAAY